MTTTLRGRKATAVLAGAITVGLAVSLSACSSSDTGSLPGSTAPASGAPAADYDAIIADSPVADASVIADSEWATAIKESGVLRRGGSETGALFSIKDPATGEVTGFDAGLGDMLAHYILGDEWKTELTVTTVDTRETLLQNDSVDVVVATYSITEPRAEKIDFAGPYYESGTAVMVAADNTDIEGVDDLAGKNVTTQANSTGVTALDEFAPDAKQTNFEDDASCLAALKQGRVDAYVIDQSILLSDAVKNPGEFKIVGEPFTTDPYGIGVKKDSGAKEFVDEWLKTIEEDGSWAKLWKASVGTVVEGEAPAAPEIGSVPGS